MLLRRFLRLFRPPEPTFRELIETYRASRSFHDLASSTKRVYARVLDHLLAEIGPNLPLSQLTRARVERHLACRSRGAAVEHLKKLRVVCHFGLAVGLLQNDPTLGVQKPRGERARHTWTEEEIAAFRAFWPLGSGPRLAMELGLGTGQRRGDLHKMRWEDIHDGAITVVQGKTRRPLRIPIGRDLRRALAQEKIRRTGPILRTAAGEPFSSAASMGAWFQKRCREAGLPDGCRLHGLRRALCRRLAEAGASAREIGAVSGHLSLTETDRYSRDASQLLLAQRAMKRLGVRSRTHR